MFFILTPLLTYWMSKSELDVRVQIKQEECTVRVDEGSDYEQLVRGLMLNPEEVLIFVNGIAVPSDERVKPGRVRIVEVVSGG